MKHTRVWGPAPENFECQTPNFMHYVVFSASLFTFSASFYGGNVFTFVKIKVLCYDIMFLLGETNAHDYDRVQVLTLGNVYAWDQGRIQTVQAVRLHWGL